jgi:peptide/nickel transport system substrate-binding protein
MGSELKRRKRAVVFAFLLLSLAAFWFPLRAEKTEVVFTGIWPYDPPPAGHWNPYATGYHSRFQPLIYEPLAYFLPANQTWKPWLAERWNFATDMKSLVVYLRRGIKWADGTNFTSADVIATFYCDYVVSYPVWRYKSIYAPDKYTVIFNFTKVWKTAPISILTHVIYPRTLFGNFSDRMQYLLSINATAEEFSKLRASLISYRPPQPIGTGAFIPISITESEAWFQKNPNYWRGADTVHVDKFRWIRQTSDDQRNAWWLTGEIDFGGGMVPIAFLKDFMKRPNITILVSPRPAGLQIYFNTRKYPLSLVEVRQAIAYAINRTEATAASMGTGPYAAGKAITIPALMFQEDIDSERWFSKDFVQKYLNSYNYNISKTVEILQKLGFRKGTDGIWVSPNGTRLEISISAPSGWMDCCLVAESVASQLQKVGIAAVARMVPNVQFFQDEKNGAFDMAVDSFSYSFNYEPATYSKTYVDLTLLNKGIGFNPVVDVPWLGKVNVSQCVYDLDSTVDPKEVNKIYQILAYVTNYYLPTLTICRTYTHNFVNHARFVWPEPGDPFYESYNMMYYSGVAYIISSGNLRPRVAVSPQKPQLPSPPYELYAIIGVLAIIAVAGWIIALKKTTKK